MDSEIHNRVKILNELKIMIGETEKEINFVLHSLGWNLSYIKNKVEQRIPHINDKSYSIGNQKLTLHIDLCKSNHQKYNKYDEMLPLNINENPLTKIKIDKELCASIISKSAQHDPVFKKGISDGENDNRPTPISYNEMIHLYTSDERRVLYDYAITQTRKYTVQTSFHDPIINDIKYENENLPKSFLEEIALIRDMKRRKTKYRVSTKSKSYTEVLRGVIDNFMKIHQDETNLKMKITNIKKDKSAHSEDLKKKYEKKQSKHRSYKDNEEIPIKRRKFDY